ncbi:alpha/beta hydrolase (plasmid) [Streptomyces sp. NBC_00464]|uniref:alpha/beta hydrolase n=1 Tax=Streptomyces sp. NBC_00464 TaxID=2975751 RepID=UPI002E172315
MSGRQTLGVVFVHGIDSSAKTWDAVRVALAQTEDLTDVEPQPRFEYATGLFGRGWLNPFRALRVLPSIDTVADSLAAYLDTETTDLQRLVLVGHSMGGLVIQRYLTRMLHRGRSHDLARIRRIVLLACPNTGSDLLLSLRKQVSLRNRQEQQLRPFDEQVSDTHAIVLRDIVNAPGVTANSCPIPFSVYAGETDRVVLAASARSVFPNALSLPGDHFTILREERTFNTLKQLLREAAQAEPPRHAASAPSPSPSTAGTGSEEEGPSPKAGSVEGGSGTGAVTAGGDIIGSAIGEGSKAATPADLLRRRNKGGPVRTVRGGGERSVTAGGDIIGSAIGDDSETR